jgi:hypothetical protein
MTNGFVTVRGKKYYVKKGKLEIRFKKIANISEIMGMGNLTNLQELILDHNKIREIQGLENLTQLRELDLRFNEITEIKGLAYLTNLQKLYLKGNPIRADEVYLIDKSPQEIVRYCQEKAKQLSARIQAPTAQGTVIPPVEVASPPMTDMTITASTPSNRCQSCGFLLEGDMMFCPNCGVEIATGIKPSISMKTCPSCGLPLEKDMIFCPNCGISLGRDGDQ